MNAMGKKNKLKNRRQIFCDDRESIKDVHGKNLTAELLAKGVPGNSNLMEASLQMFDELTNIGERHLNNPLKMFQELTREALYYWNLPLQIKTVLLIGRVATRRN